MSVIICQLVYIFIKYIIMVLSIYELVIGNYFSINEDAV